MSRIGRLARATVALVSAFVSVARNTNPLVLFGAHRWGCERGGIGRGWRRVVIREAGLRPRLTQFRPMGWKSAAHQTAELRRVVGNLGFRRILQVSVRLSRLDVFRSTLSSRSGPKGWRHPEE